MFLLRKRPFRGQPIYPNHKEREAMILSSYAGILMVRKRTLFVYMKMLYFLCTFRYECIFTFSLTNAYKCVRCTDIKCFIF